MVTPITASLAALDGFNACKLAVLTPYTDDVNAAIAAHLESRGKEVCACTLISGCNIDMNLHYRIISDVDVTKQN